MGSVFCVDNEVCCITASSCGDATKDNFALDPVFFNVRTNDDVFIRCGDYDTTRTGATKKILPG